jgi:hypothetical protein
MESCQSQGQVGEVFKNTLPKKVERVIGGTPLEWCWFDCIDQILASTTKVDNLPRVKDMGTPIGSHQSIKDVNHYTKLKCKILPPPCDTSFRIHRLLVLIDGTHTYSSLVTPHTCACHQ